MIYSLLALPCVLFAQDSYDFPIILEAEDATLAQGSDYESVAEGDVTYVRINSDYIDLNSPGNAARVMTFDVTFPQAGIWNLYIRLYVGQAGGSDDSFFYASDFGDRDSTDPNHWITCNYLDGGYGFTQASDLVQGGGSAQSQVWKWINLSMTSTDEAPVPFFVGNSGSLTKSFMLGAREDGLLIDKIAFGLESYEFTVDNLNNGTQGTAIDISFDPLESTGLPLATGSDKFLGCIYSDSQVINFTQYWNQVVPENDGKWGSVEGIQDSMYWTKLDNARDLAKDNGFPFRFHVLVWGSQQPTWMRNLSSANQLVQIQEWFSAVAQRYGSDIDYLEVVNEPTHRPPIPYPNSDKIDYGGYRDALQEGQTYTYHWVIKAFRMARATFPSSVKLMINDYGILSGGAGLTNYLGIISELQKENLVDVIGVQGHAFSTTVDASIIQGSLDQLAATGLPIMVTEMDIDGGYTTGNPAELYIRDFKHLLDYNRIFPVIWEHPSIIGVTLWGYRPGTWRDNVAPYLVYSDGEERPAMQWLRTYVRGTIPNNFERYLADNKILGGPEYFTLDTDGDSIPDGLEFLMGSSLSGGNGFPMQMVYDSGSGGAMVSLPVAIGLAEGTVIVEASTDLIAWAEAGRYDFASQTGNNVQLITKNDQEYLDFYSDLTAQNPDYYYYRIVFELD